MLEGLHLGLWQAGQIRRPHFARPEWMGLVGGILRARFHLPSWCLTLSFKNLKWSLFPPASSPCFVKNMDVPFRYNCLHLCAKITNEAGNLTGKMLAEL